jgi:hypothetical protein
MGTEKKPTPNSFFERINIQIITPIIAIIISVYTCFTTVRSGELDHSIKKIDSTSKVIDNIKNSVETDLRQKDFKNQLKLKLYEEVKFAVNNKSDKNDELVALMVNSMIDSTEKDFKENLLALLKSKDSKVLDTLAVKNLTFTKDQKMNLDSSKMKIDVFYLEDVYQESQSRAAKIFQILTHKYPGYIIRLRLLPKTINVQQGYRIDSNQIRFEKGTHEEALSKSIVKLITNEKIFSLEQLQEHTVKNKTPNYISLFVRNM